MEAPRGGAVRPPCVSASPPHVPVPSPTSLEAGAWETHAVKRLLSFKCLFSGQMLLSPQCEKLPFFLNFLKMSLFIVCCT